MYVWTRSKIVYSNPDSTEYTTPLCDSSWEAVNELEEEVNTTIADNVSQLTETIATNSTDMQQNNEEFVLSALTNYVTMDEHNTSIETLESEMKLESNKFTLSFETNAAQINDILGRLSTVETNLSKHFDFTLENGLVIKAGENEMQLQLDNDVIKFMQNGEEFGTWDGVDFRTGNIVIGVNERAQFGNYAYLPLEDKSLMFVNVEGE